MALELTPLTRLFNNARVHLPGSVDAMLKLEFYNVLDEFLQFTHYWQEDIDYETVVDQTHYELEGTEAGQIISLINNVNDAGAMVAATMADIGCVDLVNTPNLVETLTATVAYTVIDPTDTDDYPSYPEDVLEKYGKGILSGLIGAMMTQPAKPYSNQQLAVFHTRKFAGAKAQARADVRHRNIYAGQRWCYPSFAKGSQR